MDDECFVALALTNEANRRILERLPSLGLRDAWLVSGSLFQTVWNALTGRPPSYGIKDYDLFYFDEDTSFEAEDAAIQRVAKAFADLGGDVELRNQARVHLWYEGKFGTPYLPLRSAREGIDRFLAPACMVGLQPDGTLYAPMGLDDIATMTIRPNRTPNFSAARYVEKAARWKLHWPELTVMEA